AHLLATGFPGFAEDRGGGGAERMIVAGVCARQLGQVAPELAAVDGGLVENADHRAALTFLRRDRTLAERGARRTSGLLSKACGGSAGRRKSLSHEYPEATPEGRQCVGEAHRLCFGNLPSAAPRS